MSMPVLNPCAQRIYDEVQPIAYGDSDSNNWALAQFIQAWTQAMVLIESVVRDTDLGPGWSTVMDPNTAPALFLDWLGQFVGVRPISGESEASKRARINAVTGLRRGSPGAIQGAVQRTLTGTQTVMFNERESGNAWKLGIVTLTSETPSSADTLAAILRQKPAGITLDYVAASGQTYLTLRINYATYALAKAHFPTYLDLRNNLP